MDLFNTPLSKEKKKLVKLLNWFFNLIKTFDTYLAAHQDSAFVETNLSPTDNSVFALKCKQTDLVL